MDSGHGGKLVVKWHDSISGQDVVQVAGSVVLLRSGVVGNPPAVNNEL